VTFLWPKLLWLFALLPVAAAIYVVARRRGRRVGGTVAGMLAPAGAGGPRWRRRLPPLLYLVSFGLLIAALARPAAVISVPSQHETVILAIDISGSMRAVDVKPSRILAAQEAARAFVADVPRRTRIGVVAFAATASVVQYPTDNRENVLAAIDRFQLQRGTATGSAILVALKAIFPDLDVDLRATHPRVGKPADASRKADEAPKPEPVAPGSYAPAAIVLVTDGETTTGPLAQEAAKIAAERGVRVYTIGIGTPAGERLTVDGWTMRVRLDEAELKAIARTTGAEYFRAGTGAQLKAIYESLRTRILFERRETEVSALFAAVAGAVLALGAGCSLAWFNRIL
jgi:Ca-activated chloride channel family protein